MILELLNIDNTTHDVGQFYDQENKCRVIRIRLKLILRSKWKRRARDLHKDQKTLIWRYWHQTAMGVLTESEQSGFDLLQANLTEDREYLLLIAKAKNGIAVAYFKPLS